MKEDVFDFNLTAFSSDITLNEAIISLVATKEPWIIDVLRKVKNNEEVPLIRSENYYSFLDEYAYNVKNR
jgi:hypothetical protein